MFTKIPLSAAVRAFQSNRYLKTVSYSDNTSQSLLMKQN